MDNVCALPNEGDGSTRLAGQAWDEPIPLRAVFQPWNCRLARSLHKASVGALEPRPGDFGQRATVQTTGASRCQMAPTLKEIDMLIGGGLLGTIVIVLLIVFLARRV